MGNRPPPTRSTGSVGCKAGTAVAVRSATIDDADAIEFFADTVLRRDYFLRRGQLADMIGSKRHVVLIAEFRRLIVGIAILTRGKRLANLLVHPAVRGIGVGSRLVRESGARSVRAKVDMSTGDPRRYYERLGFRSTGRWTRTRRVELMERPPGPGEPTQGVLGFPGLL